MPTQKQIADHLDMSQQAVAELMEKLGIFWKTTSLDELRIIYIRHLRAQAAGHKSEDGFDLIRERVMTERVDRELKLLNVAEKKGVLVNVSQLEPELMNMAGAFRIELLSRDDKLKSDLDALYGIDIDVSLLNEHTYSALSQLGRYQPGGEGVDRSAGEHPNATGAADDDGMGAQV